VVASGQRDVAVDGADGLLDGLQGEGWRWRGALRVARNA
jgi:hypothetical protein